MKKKSPDKESSYKNFDSGEIKEIKTSSESWTKYSFIELLVTILVKTRGLIDSLYFHFRFLPDNSGNSRGSHKFSQNVSVFFLLFFLIPLYRSSNQRVTKQKDFISTQIQKQTQKQTHNESDSIDNNIKYNSKLVERFEPSSYKLQPFVEVVKMYKDSPFNLLVCHEKFLLDDLAKIGKYELIGRSNSYKYFFGSHSYLKKVSNPNLFLLERISLGYSRNPVKLEDILFRSSLSLKKEIDLCFPNYIECNFHGFFVNYYWYLWGSVQQQQILAKDKYILDKLVNSDLEKNLDNILSTMMHRNPKFLSQKTKNSNNWTVNQLFIKECFESNSCLIHVCIDRKRETSKETKTSLINFTKYYKYHFQWLTRIMYMEDKELLYPGSIYKNIPAILFFLETKNFCEEIPRNKNEMNDSIHSQRDVGIADSRGYIYNTFSQQLLVNDFGINTITDRNSHRILKENRKHHYLNTFLGVRGIEITSFIKIQKNYSKLLFNFSLPFNSVYNFSQQNFLENKKILKSWKNWKHFLLRIFHRLLPIHSILRDSNIFVNQIELNRDLKTKKSNLSTGLGQKIETFQLSFQQLTTNKSGKYNLYDNCKNAFINYLSILVQTKSLNYYDSTPERWKEYLSQFMNFLYSKKKLLLGSYPRQLRNMNQKFLVHKAIEAKNLIRGIREYDNLICLGYKQINRISNWFIFDLSEILGSNKFLKKTELFDLFGIFIQKDVSRGFGEFLDFLKTLFNQLHVHNSSFKRSKKYTDQSLLTILCLDWNSLTHCLLIEPFIVRLNNASELLVLFPKIHLNSMKNSQKVLMPNLEVNWNRRFSLYLDRFSILNFDIIYPLLFFNLSEFYEIALRVLEEKAFVTEIVNSTISNSQLSADSRMLYRNRINSKLFPEVFKKFHLEYFFVNIPPNEKMVLKFHAYVLRYVLSIRDMNIKISRVMSKILLHLGSDLKFKSSKYKVQNRVTREKNIASKYSRFDSILSSTKLFLLAESMLWFFTPEWWEYHTDLFLRISRQTFSIIHYYLKYLGSLDIQIVTKQFVNSWQIDKNLHDFTSEWKSEVFVDHGKIIIPIFTRCFNYRFIKNWHGFLAILTIISFISFLKRNLFSILIGSNSLCLWKHFETIEYLKETSQAFHSIGPIILTREGSKKTNNLVIHFFENLKRCMRDVRFSLLMNKKLDDWLINNKGLDLSRREKSSLVQSLITCTRVEKYGFKSYPKRNQLSHVSGYRVTNQQGFSYLRYLSWILKKKFVNHPLVLTNKWIHLASLQRMIFSRTLLNINAGVQQIPVPIQFGLSHAKGILLIGPIETGRSYLVKNSAANSCVPLLGINIDKFLYNKPDVITESWISVLIESLRGLNLILDLANEMSPCLIWIRNIHRLDVNRPTRNIESEPAFLLGILSKYFQINPKKIRTRKNVIIIGSTSLPGKVDPAFISADRLDQIINIRASNNSWRKNHFFILLNTKNIRLKSEFSYLNGLDSKTTGYTTRDIAALTNEVSLISIAKNESFVCNNTIELAFHRQILRFTHMSDKSYFLQNFGILFYKLGRAIIQNLLIESSTMNPLSISNYSWKKNFYHLAEWYLESSVNKSIVKEFTVMIHALGCLAGIAARDSWFLLEEESDTAIALDKSVENDLKLASSILESLPIEFSRLEICETRFVTYKQQKKKVSLTMNSSNIIQNELLAVTGEDTIRNDSKDESSISRHIFLSGIALELQTTAWSPRPWRLSFCRSNLFDWIKRPNDSESIYRREFAKSEKNIISKDLGNHNNTNRLVGKGKQQLIYERILPRVRKRNVEELEFQLELILLEEQSEILGFRRPSTQYQMEYQVDNKPKFFIGKRIVWDPTGSSTRIRNPIFCRREFFADEEILRRLYVTYGVRRERERSLFNHKIKRFFLRRGYNKELINKLSIRWWDQLPPHEEQSIDTWKRIEEIGVRLRRPQVFTPVYLYQRWLIENLPEKFIRFEFITQRQRWLGVANLSLANSFAYTTLLESYQYLLEFLSSKKVLLNRAMKTLLIKKWLFQNEIEYLIHNFNKKK